LSNIKFAQAVEPDNRVLADYAARCMALRAGNLPTLPSSIALERQINPFLRTEEASVAYAARTQHPGLVDDPVAVLGTLREWKNRFR